MKKLAIIAGLCLLPILGLSQVSDIVKDGFRLVTMPTENVRNFTDRVVFYAGLGAATIDAEKQAGIDSVHYYFHLAASAMHDFQIPEDGKLLVKLFDGSILELRNKDKTYASLEFIGNIRMYRALGIYPIAESEVQRIISSGVTKIRMETSTEAIDNNWKKDKIGKVLSTQYPQIKAAISQEKSFDSDF